MDKARKKEEAISRMKKWDLYEPIIREFEQYGKLEYSENTRLGGILYWVDNEPEWAERIARFEKEHNALVYHAMHYYLASGFEILALLYVSDQEDTWEYDNLDLEEGFQFVYTVNLTDDKYSEFGTIPIRQVAGGLVPNYNANKRGEASWER